MKPAQEILLHDARSLLLRELAELKGRRDLDEAFVAWLLIKNEIGLSPHGAAESSASHMGAQRTYRDVATLGFAAAAGSLEPQQQNSLIDGLKWLAGREPSINGVPAGFCTDAIALLGIALGVKQINSNEINKAITVWMQKFITTSYRSASMHDWQMCLFTAVQQIINGQPTLVVPDNPSIADVRIALTAKGVLVYGGKDILARDEMQVLTLLKDEAGTSIGITRSALRVTAFDWISWTVPEITLSRPSIEEVCQLLRRVPAGLRRWTWEDKPRTSGRDAQARKWHIDNEYHVQNLLYALLAPIFPDLRDEEYTPSVGSLHPRIDICIPSLKLLIEVKFMRQNKTPNDLIEEIAADASLYLASPSSYKSIIAFIWDDSSRTELHSMLIQGLKQIQGIVDVIIVPRPGMMM